MNNNLQAKPVSEEDHPHSEQELYYKFICIDQQHSSLACQQLSAQDNMKAICLGRAVVISINTNNIEQSELISINSFLAKVQVEAMAFSDTLSEYDMIEVDKV